MSAGILTGVRRLRRVKQGRRNLAGSDTSLCLGVLLGILLGRQLAGRQDDGGYY
jgi:hypothetical protein